MKYLYLQDENEEYWIELDDENYAVRQIIRESNDTFHLSCLEDCLAEGPIYDESGFKIISYDTFECIWKNCISEHEAEWEKIKKQHILGCIVKLRVECFYPQGVILKGSSFLAIYKGDNSFYLHENVNMQVIQYDEENHWLVVC